MQPIITAGMGEVEIGKNSFHYGLAAVFDDGKTAVSAQLEGNQVAFLFISWSKVRCVLFHFCHGVGCWMLDAGT